MSTKKQTHNISEMLKSLREEPIHTWFDLGLFIDRLRDRSSASGFKGSFGSFKKKLKKEGLAFITFHYTIDGITIEVEKYAKTFRNMFPGIPIHYIAGDIREVADELIHSDFHRKEIPEIDGFNNWPLYEDFFHTKLERGSKEYNRLIIDYWNDVLLIVEKLGSYIEENGISLLYLINVCSNPGNASLSLACVLISEYLGIPVINNNHDFYWEGGNRAVDISTKGLTKGPRDFFFNNAHVGEFFSLIDVLFPWESRSWMSLNINHGQSDHVIKKNGHNPANVALLGTAVDLNAVQSMSKRDTVKAFMQIAEIFANKKDAITVHTASNHIKSERSLKPILLGHQTILDFDFVNNNIVFLQPTRVIKRKSIELNFKLVKQLFSNAEFAQKFIDNPGLHLSIIVTGPISLGQSNYYEYLIRQFTLLMDMLPEHLRSRVLLGFLFSEFDKQYFKEKYSRPLDINQLYNVASLILLPSQTEGRGLPIIEAAACGTPIFCRQYEPREVYEEVIGYHLNEDQRLKVLEFQGSKIPKKLIDKIITHVFYPQNMIQDLKHNRRVIKNRYSLEALQKNFEYILERLHLQLNSIEKEKDNQIASLLRRYKKILEFDSEDLKVILNRKSRHYLPGYGRLKFMILLKSLIDPSYFRVEEHLVRGKVMTYARNMENMLPDHKDATLSTIHNYYNTVDRIFRYSNGEFEIRHDHSMAYRHRNKKYFPYQELTYHEITGLVNMIYHEVFRPKENPSLALAPQFFSDWDLALYQLTNSKSLGIDNRKILTERLKRNVPKGYFPGRYIKHELEYFVLQPVRAQLKLSIEDELTEAILKERGKDIQQVYIFVHEQRITKWFSFSYIKKYLKSNADAELSLLFRAGIIQIIETGQWCEGVHFPQMGEKAIKALRKIKEADGFIITNGEHAVMMTDIIGLDHFHIGKASNEMTAKMLGIPLESGYIQFVPAGVRTTLAYPTPIQTSKDFDNAIKSRQFRRLEKKIGEKELFALMGKDAEDNGTPIVPFLDQLEAKLNGEQTSSNVKASFVGGVYEDGLPWSGVMAEVDTQKQKWNFAAHTANKEPKNVPGLVKEYKAKSGNKNKIELAWNGGYILNPELVGKLGLPETYIGSPLGLLIMDEEVECPPLFNKPAIIIYKDGRIDIRKVNCRAGLGISGGGKSIRFTETQYNSHSKSEACYYDLIYEEEHIRGDGNVIIRLAGNTVKQIIYTKKGEKVKRIPVGLTLSIPSGQFSKGIFREGKKVDIELFEPAKNKFSWSQISYAVEAGPMLIDKAKNAVDMVSEGWKTSSSIRTQAARLDFTDMRGPKIAVGITKKGKLMVLMVNGRIRESVGATHFDMADILKSFGMDKAMGFDPGGSSTLVVDGKVMNISPYNKKYEEDIYSLPPEPRFVANAVVGWIENSK